MEHGEVMLMVENNIAKCIPYDLQTALGLAYWDGKQYLLTTLGEAYVSYWVLSGKFVWIVE